MTSAATRETSLFPPAPAIASSPNPEAIDFSRRAATSRAGPKSLLEAVTSRKTRPAPGSTMGVNSADSSISAWLPLAIRCGSGAMTMSDGQDLRA